MSFCLWLTGLPGSGKSTILEELLKMFSESRVEAAVLNLDKIRKIVTPEPKYTEEERGIVYRSLVMMARLLTTECGKNVVIDATGNRRKYRDLARRLVPGFAEIYIECPLEICTKREALRRGGHVGKDLYRRAGEGSLSGDMPGVSVPYEPPVDPEVIVRSDVLSPVESAEKIMGYIQSRGSK
jgi:adenylylsulfate kinase